MINNYKNLIMYRILSVIGYLEFVLIPPNLINIYVFENPSLRPSGTIFVAVCILIIFFPLNILLFLGLRAEKYFRKNVCERFPKKITKIGFNIFIFNTIIGLFLFLFSVYLIIR